MPFLRAALLKKKAIQEQEEEKLLPPVAVAAEESEPEPETLPSIDNLLRVMDEKAKEAEEAEEAEQTKENEIAELDEGHSDDIAEPEVVSDVTEDIHVPEVNSDSDTVSEVQEEEPQEETEIESESVEETEEISEPETQPEPEQDQETETGTDETETDKTETTSTKDYSGETLNYDFTSGKRYVDLVSKTDFDRMLDELSAISKDLLSHEAEKFAKQFTGKFQGDFDKAESDAKKYEAFLGGYITNAAMLLYDNGYREAAIKQLEQAKSILEARKKLEDETAAIKTRVEEENDSVDLSDLLGLFGD